jgi:hypothetical protein
VSSPVTTIDVVATDDSADEFLRDVVEFVGGLGAAEHAKGARSVLAEFSANTIRYAPKSLFPRGRTMFPVFPDQWSGQPFTLRLAHAFTFPGVKTANRGTATSSQLPQIPYASKAAHKC